VRQKRRDAKKKTTKLTSKLINSFRDANRCSSIINELHHVACCHGKYQTEMSLLVK